MIRAGLLDKIITIKKPLSNTKNDFGEDEITYDSGTDTRARVVFQADNRTIENGELVFPQSLKITVRSYVSVTNDSIVVWNDNEYRILSIDDTIKGEININAELIND